MKILLACEESQAVCTEFRNKGYEAYSCDILDSSGPNKNWHIKGDVLNVIYDYKWKWDMMIAFPPCTHLAVSGARHFEQKIKDGINANIMCIMYTNYVHHVRYVRTIRHRVRKRACVFVQHSFNAGAALELEQLQSCGLLPPVEKA